MTVTDLDGHAPGERFGFGDRLEIIAAESRRLSDVVAALDLEARVPSTPEWTVRDLAHHIGEVQWYWGENVRAQNPDERSGASLTAFPEDVDLLAWMGWCTYSLLGALREVGPEAPCWAWWPEPHTAGAVGRHQAQEASVHRWDAEGVTGASEPLHEGLAEDGVPEFIEIMVGADLASLPGAVTLTAIDTGASWRVAGAAAGAAGPDGSARSAAGSRSQSVGLGPGPHALPAPARPRRRCGG